MSYEAISGSSPAQFSLKQRDELLPDLPQSLEQSAVSLLSCVAILTILCVFGLVCLVALSLKYRDATIRWASNQENCPSVSFKIFALEKTLCNRTCPKHGSSVAHEHGFRTYVSIMFENKAEITVLFCCEFGRKTTLTPLNEAKPRWWTTWLRRMWPVSVISF